MTPVIRIDDDVMNELKKRAVDLDMVFSSPNEVLKVVLVLTTADKNLPDLPKKPTVARNTSGEMPQSSDPEVQELLDGLLQGISDLCSCFNLAKSGRWIASPNFMTITVQDARAHNLAITVYGSIDDFKNLQSNVHIQPDRSGYSRFNIDRQDQLPSAIQVIRRAHQLKQKRSRRS